MCTQGSELLARTPWQKPLPPGVQCFQAVPFALDLDYVFPELLRGAQISPPLPSVRFSHTFLVQVDSLVSLNSFLESLE